MAIILNRTTTFATNGTVTAAGLHNLIDDTAIYSGLITTQTNLATVGTGDKLLIAQASGGDTTSPFSTTVLNLFDDALTGGTYTSLNLTGALTYGTATGNRTVSTSATITTGTIPNLTSSTANITLGTIPTLTTGTTTSTAANITNLSSTTSTFLGAITASTNTINVGSGQIYKDASGNVGIGTSSNTANSKLEVYGNSAAAHVGLRVNNAAADGYGTLWISNNGSNDGLIRGGASAASFTNQLAIITSGTTPITIATNNTERLRIDSAGQIGIGGANYGTSGQVLTSAGASTAPSWTTISTTPADGSITPAKLSQPFTSGTAVASTSGTAVNFTGIPSWVKRITVMFDGVSLSGTDSLLIQIGDSGGLENTGYNGGGARMSASAIVAATFTTGFGFNTSTAAVLHSGSVVINNVTGNTWSASGTLGGSASIFVNILGGSKSLSSQLDRVSVTRNGTDTFDAGSINIMYEG